MNIRLSDSNNAFTEPSLLPVAFISGLSVIFFTMHSMDDVYLFASSDWIFSERRFRSRRLDSIIGHGCTYANDVMPDISVKRFIDGRSCQ